MNDSNALRDAFRGFEDQADRLSQARAATGDAAIRSTGTPTPRRRMLVVACAAIAVAAVVTGVAFLVPGAGSNDHGAANIAPPTPTSVTSTPATSAPATSVRTSPEPDPDRVPRNRREMIAAFKRVLGNTATFTVTQSEGNYLTGILTAAGHRGGFDIQAYDGKAGDKAQCEDAATSHCTVRTTSNGGSLSTGHESVGGAMLYLVNYVRPDGGSYLWHLSTQADPKRGGESLGSKPPLTIRQMVKILESDRWQ